jgi:hypothetical protein
LEFGVYVHVAYRDKKVVGVFVRFSCAASRLQRQSVPKMLETNALSAAFKLTLMRPTGAQQRQATRQNRLIQAQT